MVELTTVLLLATVAFAGGAFGAALGALPAFAFTGFVVIAGEVVTIGRNLTTAAAGEIGTAGAYGLTASVGLGAGFGPHVAFAGGAAAAAYAARRGKMNTGFDYHEAKNITYSLGTDVDVLAVGGAFGAVGYLVYHVSLNTLALPFEPFAFSIVVTALLHRIAFGYPLVGRVRGGLLDMSPYERGERRAPGPGGEEVITDGGLGSNAAHTSGIEPTHREPDERRYVVEPWLPQQYEWADVAVLGAVVGVFGAFVAYVTASPFLGFGIAAASLLFLSLGMERFPVTHHMALPAGLVTVALAPGAPGPSLTAATLQATVPLWLVVAGGALFGLLGGLLGELAQRALYAHADTHLDPPAVSILLTTLLLAVLDIAGVFSQAFVPTLGI
jgi:hypothetical protein